jgi:hypothetical protein
MRTVFLVPLALTAAVAAAGCGSAPHDTEQAAARVPERDLTLRQAESSEFEVVSPVELGREPVQQATAQPRRHVRAAARAPRAVAVSARSVEAPAPAPVSTASSSPTAMAAAAEAEAPDPHALAPGQTVTVLTASGGPTSDEPASSGDWTDQLPANGGGGTTIHGGRGGNCGGRGHGGLPAGGGGFRGLR